ncbi:O-antigen ligase family protein [Microbacterium azadirachtae]|uniref:O-Antigen ligase n=1 Tax=Microbacterium azadirachtae TaxID=582680 RepID=A0A0F0KZM9_9MICO|nr:O-antigen ligase family protein [Microbacterium azadirachtae]KJL26328.1 O-Antigen ligase [Microbacterium azadirachtae]UXW85245.1 O-antigen ligase family protein [Microbacterium azadirachtae]SDM43078.1 O-antigen ligase [Microbacterium azadirachtae]SEG57320.1 O-antigen ligase [Microbacterium azadirachtae]SEG60270.1 O-antigen ligase [Microbacterium azadirachtae]
MTSINSGSRVIQDAAPATGAKPLSRIGQLLVAGLIPVAALNPVLPHVGPVSSFTAYAIIFFVYAIGHIHKRPPSRLRLLIALFSIVVLGIALVTLANRFGALYASAEAVVVAGGLFITLGLISLPSTRNTIKSLLLGWLLASIITTVLAIVELLTGHHFGPSYLDANPGASKTGVVVVFFNPNNYAAFLTLTIPLLIAGARLTSRVWVRRAYYLAAFASVPIMFLTSSRFGLAALVLGAAVWVILRVRSRVAQAAILVFALIGVIAVLVMFQGRTAGDISAGISRDSYEITIGGIKIPSDSSLLARWNLALNGLDMIAENPFGSGPGGYELSALSTGTSRMTFGMVNPHNGAIEFATQYGVFLGIIAALITVTLLATALRANSVASRRSPDRALAAATVAVIWTLPLLFGMHSTFVDVPHEWLGFATFATIGVYLTQYRGAPRTPDAIADDV